MFRSLRQLGIVVQLQGAAAPVDEHACGFAGERVEAQAPRSPRVLTLETPRTRTGAAATGLA